jgi:hypothetical protein
MRECVMAPRSKTEYAAFHLGSVLTAEGDEIPVGKIVQDTRHASIALGYAAAALHYDNTGDEIAIIRCGEDDYGIWFAGAVVPEATRKRVAKLRRSPLSGDWRRERGSLELTAALAVNAPAFPVYAMEDEEVNALVAAGTVYEFWEEDVDETSTVFAAPPNGIVTPDDFAAERAMRFQDLLEDEEIYESRDRADRFALLQLAAGTEAVPAPAPATPVPAAAGTVPAPEDAAVAEAEDTAGMLARQMDARFSVVEEAGTAAPAPAAAPVTPPVVPAAGAPAPGATTAPAAPVAVPATK